MRRATSPDAIRSAEAGSTAVRAIADLAPKLAALTDEVVFGDMWERPGLSKRDRSLITVSALVALYRTEQLPSGVRQFKAQRAWRCWSRTNPLVHLALYEFGTVEEAEAILDSAALASQSAEFDRVWGTGITRTREVVEVAEELSHRPDN